jgi:hypothetical protein
MALPTAYTEKTFAEFLRRKIRGYAEVFHWDNTEAEGDYQDVINDTLRIYGVSSIDQATDIARLELLGLRAAWRAVVEYAATEYDYATVGESNSRSQLYKQAQERLADVEAAVAATIPEVAAASMPVIGIGSIRWRDDGYDLNPQRAAVVEVE